MSIAAAKKNTRSRVSDLNPASYNPRKITDEQLARLGKAMKEFGDLSGIVVNVRTGNIVGGHQRLKHLDPSWKITARKASDSTGTVATGYVDTPFGRWTYREVDWPQKKERVANVAANKHGGEFELDGLREILAGLNDQAFDMDLTGFDQDELNDIFGDLINEGQTDPDVIPEPPDEATTQPGDLLVLGNHRLLCGNSSKAEDLDLLLDGAVIHLVNMDPPYNVKVEPRSNTAIAAGLSSFSNKKAKLHHQGFDQARGVTNPSRARKKMQAKDRPLENDFVSAEAFDEMLMAWFQNASRVLKPGGSFYIWGGYANLGNYPGPLKAAGLYFSQGIVWDKQHPVLTRKDFMGAFEICFYGWKEGAGHHFHGPTNATDLWHIKKVNPQSMIHLTEKPVELAVRAVQYSSKPGDNVLDLFGGSGSTLIGCEQTARKAFLMELDPLYCDVIVKRWEDFTGKKAERIR